MMIASIMPVLAMIITTTSAIDAPPTVCYGLIPLQPAPAQTSPPPYYINTDFAAIAQGESIKVTISSIASHVTMSSILLQARQGDMIVGKWSIDKDDNIGRILDCGEPGNTVTHKEHVPQLDKHNVSYYWTAPSDLLGEVKFMVTVTRSYGIFWARIVSRPVNVLPL